MPLPYAELETAVTEVLRESGQSAEFQRGLRKLIENAIETNTASTDLARILELAKVSGDDGEI